MKFIVFMMSVVTALLVSLPIRSENMGLVVSAANVYEVDKNIEYGLLPFVVTLSKPSNVYVDPVWGVTIEKIVVDGSSLKVSNYDIDLDDINLNLHSVEGENFVYSLPFNNLVFGKYENGDYELSRYVIPENFNELSIYYRLVKPGEGPSKQLNLLKIN
ncbi:hypothetical protein [Microbulbifer sp. TRSA005]|uniref:hypothetical protein n=1 Tax=Microbulbifer sp. TRSA005 TaxID=3243383 RepID=UPI004039E8F8